MPTKCPKGERHPKICIKKRVLAPAMTSFRKAAQAEGYMVKGGAFKPLPKKGTAAYKKIKTRAASM